MGCDYFVDKEKEDVILEVWDYDGNFSKKIRISTDKFEETELDGEGKMRLEVHNARAR